VFPNTDTRVMLRDDAGFSKKAGRCANTGPPLRCSHSEQDNAVTKKKHSTEQTQLSFQLPYWPDHLRGVPWVVLRTALFAPVRRGTRRAMQRETIEAISDWKITYTGFQLDQADLDVFEHVLHLAHRASLGSVVVFRTREMLKELDRSSGKSDREWLLRSLDRLQACAIELKLGDIAYTGSLIQEQGRIDGKNGSGQHYVRLNPNISNLYDHGYDMVNWQIRKSLGSNQLAKWLHGFVVTLRQPLTFKIQKLADLSNSHYSRPRDFRNAIEEAAAKLKTVGINLLIQWDMSRSNVTLCLGKKEDVVPRQMFLGSENASGQPA